MFIPPYNHTHISSHDSHVTTQLLSKMVAELVGQAAGVQSCTRMYNVMLDISSLFGHNVYGDLTNKLSAVLRITKLIYNRRLKVLNFDTQNCVDTYKDLVIMFFLVWTSFNTTGKAL